MNEDKGLCPGCGASDIGGPIPEDIVHNYVPWDVYKGGKGAVRDWLKTNPWPTWRKFLGIEVRGVYDGVLIWKCEDCNHQWPRFSREGWERLHVKALEIIENWNKEKING